MLRDLIEKALKRRNLTGLMFLWGVKWVHVPSPSIIDAKNLLLFLDERKGDLTSFYVNEDIDEGGMTEMGAQLKNGLIKK
jgi:hypothetical protein